MDKVNSQYLSTHRVNINVQYLCMANPSLCAKLGGETDMDLIMSGYINNEPYYWATYFDSTRVSLQSMINKGIEAFKKSG